MIASPNRVEEINIWIRIWGEGIGIPKAAWDFAEVQREVLFFKDGAGVMGALRTACIALSCNPNPMDNPMNQLECLSIIDMYGK